MKPGLIVNPSSGKHSGKGLALAAAVEASLPTIVLADFSQLRASLEKLAREKVDVLAISSGDGTIQAIQTLLAEQGIFATRPRLMLLAHGTTNMTAADLGVSLRQPQKLARLLTNANALTDAAQLTRPTLRIDNPADGTPRHGMFAGTGAIWRAVEYCQTAIHGTGLKGEAATFATLVSAIAGLAFGGATPEAQRIGRAWPCAVRADGTSMTQGDMQLLFLATTLTKLVLGSRPFWGGKQGELRGTVLPFPVPRLWRWLIPTLYGSETRTMPQGAESRSAQHFEIEHSDGWIVDGEFFNAPKDQPLSITRGADFTYVQP
jgi:diacylglycerol kinase (ATP)